MSFKKYYSYYLFIKRNWNFRLAAFTIFHEIRGEKKYKIQSTGFNTLEKLEVISNNKEAAYIYQPVNYYMLEKAFDYLMRQQPNGGVVDFGSGQGRILSVAAAYGFTQISGVEFSPDLCEVSNENMERVKNSYPEINVEIFCGDATIYPVKKNDNHFIFFNPFDERVMLPVIKNILRSIKENPRDIFILYFNPTEKEIFLSAGFEELWYYEKMKYLDFSILYKPSDLF